MSEQKLFPGRVVHYVESTGPYAGPCLTAWVLKTYPDNADEIDLVVFYPGGGQRYYWHIERSDGATDGMWHYPDAFITILDEQYWPEYVPVK